MWASGEDLSPLQDIAFPLTLEGPSGHRRTPPELRIVLKKNALRLGDEAVLEFVVENGALAEDVGITSKLVRSLELCSDTGKTVVWEERVLPSQTVLIKKGSEVGTEVRQRLQMNWKKLANSAPHEW